MVTEPLSDVYGDPGWMDVDSISHHVQILPEKPLRQIAKGALAKFTLGCEENG